MDKKVKRYFQLKQKQKKIELELLELRSEITSYCSEQGVSDIAIGRYKVKLIFQDRKDYDDSKLYASLPDPDVWRLLSKSDSTKISNMLKLNVINEDIIKDTYTIKHITLLQVEKN